MLHRTGQPVVTVPAPQFTVVDTAGSGDAFKWAQAAALSGGMTLPAGVGLAVAAGAAAWTGSGARAALPTRFWVR